MDQKTEKKLEEIIRVNHAGELGAQDIYKNQIKFCKDGKLKKELERVTYKIPEGMSTRDERFFGAPQHKVPQLP